MDELNNKLLKYPRGSIWLRPSPSEDRQDGVQTGTRPVVIVSSNIGNHTSQSVVVAMVTSKSEKARLGINVKFLNSYGQENVVLCNQLRTVSKGELQEFMGTLPADIIDDIDKAIREALSISSDNLDISAFNEVVDRIIEAKSHEVNKSIDITQETVNDIARKLEDIFEDILIPLDRQAKENHTKKIKESAPLLTAIIEANTENKSESKKESENDIPTTEAAKYNPGRKPRGFWTAERREEFMRDRKTLDSDTLMKKWGIDNNITLNQITYRCRKSLD